MPTTQTFPQGSMVRFNEKMITDLLAQQRNDHNGRRYLLALNERGFEVQNEPKPGRVNVRYRQAGCGPWQYRTFSARDLETI